MNLAIAVLSGIGAMQGLIFAFLVLLKKYKQPHDWILFVWFFIFSLHLSLKLAFGFKAFLIADVLIMTLGFLHGPFFWLYTKTLFERKSFPLDFVHFLPFCFFLFGSFIVGDLHNTRWEIILLIPKILVLTVYPLLVLRLLAKEKTSQTTSSPKRTHLPFLWIKTAAYIFLVSIAVGMVRLSFELMMGVSYFAFWDVLRYVFLVTIMGFFGLKYGIVYQADEQLALPKKKKYKDSPLDRKEMDMIHGRIEHFFREDGAFLHPQFSLSELSKITEIKKHHLSQVINLKMNTGFYDLVNSRRIAYAIDLMKQQDHDALTLEGLGYECGFNSKSVFFQSFKKYTGKTPGKYRREIGSD